jgi:tripartite-type tricarboxylate transporter receptor subunit TctC
MYRTLRYKPQDFVLISNMLKLPYSLSVHTGLPVKTLPEFIAYAKSRPGQVFSGTTGAGSTADLLTEMLNSATGIRTVGVPYKGSAPAISDLIGGQVSMTIDPLSSSAQHIKSGKLRALAVTTTKRSNLVPELPTMAEAGLSGYDFSAWFMLLAPKGVSPELMKKLNEDVARAVSSAELKDRYTTLGAEPGHGSLTELESFLAAEVRRFGELARAANMHVE